VTIPLRFFVRVWVAVAGLLLLLMFVIMFDRIFSPPKASDEAPKGRARLQQIRHTLLRTKLLRRARYAFFKTAMGMVGHVENEGSGPKLGQRHQYWKPSTRQHFLILLALLFSLVLTLTYEAVCCRHYSFGWKSLLPL
jgi:hypothetical protein